MNGVVILRRFRCNRRDFGAVGIRRRRLQYGCAVFVNKGDRVGSRRIGVGRRVGLFTAHRHDFRIPAGEGVVRGNGLIVTRRRCCRHFAVLKRIRDGLFTLCGLVFPRDRVGADVFGIGRSIGLAGIGVAHDGRTRGRRGRPRAVGVGILRSGCFFRNVGYGEGVAVIGGDGRKRRAVGVQEGGGTGLFDEAIIICICKANTIDHIYSIADHDQALTDTQAGIGIIKTVRIA